MSTDVMGRDVMSWPDDESGGSSPDARRAGGLRGADIFGGPRDDAMLLDVGAAQPFEIRRRSWLYGLVGLTAWALAGGFGWIALERPQYAPLPWVWGACGVLVAIGLVFAWMLRQVRTPLFVADLHGVRLLGENGWVGFLWREMGDVAVDPRRLLRGPRVRVRGQGDDREHSITLGFATNVSAPQAEIELARRRAAASY
ncbi:hypothetical protein [Aeromicrobium sp. CF3.5]|uniref:hypothetical protein n=1 Tax=Aeromicrobium sp. CF3.5 TaxID=3373078 RepID=UPI003EE717A3